LPLNGTSVKLPVNKFNNKQSGAGCARWRALFLAKNKNPPGRQPDIIDAPGENAKRGCDGRNAIESKGRNGVSRWRR